MHSILNTGPVLIAASLFAALPVSAQSLDTDVSGGVNATVGENGVDAGVAAGASSSAQSDTSTSGELGATAGSQATGAEATGSGGATLTQSADQLIGKTVVTTSGETAGEVSGVIQDTSGSLAAIEAEIGGLFGIGAEKVRIPADKVQVDGETIVTAMTMSELEGIADAQAGSNAEASGSMETSQ